MPSPRNFRTSYFGDTNPFKPKCKAIHSGFSHHTTTPKTPTRKTSRTTRMTVAIMSSQSPHVNRSCFSVVTMALFSPVSTAPRLQATLADVRRARLPATDRINQISRATDTPSVVCRIPAKPSATTLSPPPLELADAHFLDVAETKDLPSRPRMVTQPIFGTPPSTPRRYLGYSLVSRRKPLIS